MGSHPNLVRNVTKASNSVVAGKRGSDIAEHFHVFPGLRPSIGRSVEFVTAAGGRIYPALAESQHPLTTQQRLLAVQASLVTFS